MNERTTTQSDYAERLDRVFRWLADHLDDSLDLARLADVACLSPYHFHRVYRAMQGETAPTPCAGCGCTGPRWS